METKRSIEPVAVKHVVQPDDSHYARLTPQPREVVTAWGLSYNRGNIVKYVARAGHKKGSTEVDDLRKALDYLQFEIRRLEGQG